MAMTSARREELVVNRRSMTIDQRRRRLCANGWNMLMSVIDMEKYKRID